MWFAVACLIVAVRASPTIKIMEGQYKLVGPQRPSTHGQLFASLPITRNLIFIDRRIEVRFRAVGPSILSRPGKPTRHQKSEADSLEWPDRSVGAIATPNIAIPPHFNWNKWLCWPRTHGRLPRNTQRRSISPRLWDHLGFGIVAVARRPRLHMRPNSVATRGRELSRIS